MTFTQPAKRITIGSLLLLFVSATVFLPAAQAAMVGTGQLMDQAAGQQNRAHLQALLQRAELAAQLEEAGVNPAQLQARIDNLSDEEVAQLAHRLDQLPAGSGILGTAVFVFLVLLATDILGYTDVFPFVKKTIN